MAVARGGHVQLVVLDGQILCGGQVLARGVGRGVVGGGGGQQGGGGEGEGGVG